MGCGGGGGGGRDSLDEAEFVILFLDSQCSPHEAHQSA